MSSLIRASTQFEPSLTANNRLHVRHQHSYRVNGPPGTRSGGTWYSESSPTYPTFFSCGCVEAFEDFFGGGVKEATNQQRCLYCEPNGNFFTSQGIPTYVRGNLNRIPPATVWQSFSPEKDIEGSCIVAREHSILAHDDDNDELHV